LKFNCPANWEEMSQCGKSRFCQQCHKSVHDVSQLDESEATEIINAKEDTCIRFGINRRGQVWTRTGFSKTLILSSALTIACWQETDSKREVEKVNTQSPTSEELYEVMGDVVSEHEEATTQDVDCEDKKITEAGEENNADLSSVIHDIQITHLAGGPMHQSSDPVVTMIINNEETPQSLDEALEGIIIEEEQDDAVEVEETTTPENN
jgi:hypothetical protein